MEQIKTVTIPLREFDEMRNLIKDHEEKTKKLMASNCIVLLDNSFQFCYAYDPSPFREDPLSHISFHVKDVQILDTENKKEEFLKKIKSDFDHTLSMLQETNRRLEKELKELKKKQENRNLWQRIWNR